VNRSPLVVVFLVVLIDLLGFGIVLPLLPRYGTHFKAGALTLGLLMASFSAMQFLFAPLWGRLSDRIGRRPVLLVGLLGSTVFYFLFAQVTQWGNAGPILGLSPLFWLFVTRIGAGISGATIATAQAYIADVTSPAERGKGMALIGAAFGVGFTFGPLLGAAFASSSSEAPPSAAPGYVASALSAMALIVGCLRLPESLRRGEEAVPVRRVWSWSLLQQALARPVLGSLLWAIFLTTFAFAQFESTLAMLTHHRGLSDRSNFFVFAYIGLILTLAQGGLVRALITRLGEFWLGLSGVAVMVLGLALLAFASPSATLTSLAMVLPVAVVGFAATTPSLQGLLSLSAGVDEQGEILGLGQSMSALARILGPAVAFPLQSWSIPLPYWTGALLMLAAFGLMCTLPLRPVAVSGPEAGDQNRSVTA
jgi:MFS family permease